MVVVKVSVLSVMMLQDHLGVEDLWVLRQEIQKLEATV
jgi:hypothetical protein